MIIRYYDDMRFLGGAHIPDCRVHIDRHTPGLAINCLNEGRIYFENDAGRREEISAPAVFWTCESRRFKYGPLDGVRWDHYWVQAIGARTLRMRERGLFPDIDWPVAILNPHSQIPDRIAAVIDKLKENDPLGHAECVWQFEGMGLELLKSTAAVREGDGIRVELEKLTLKIRNAPVGDYDFFKIARTRGYSYSHFRRLFREHTGLSPLSYQLHCRMRMAADMLAKGGPIKKVASELGYGNLYYFSRLFKSRIGLSPRHYLDALPVSS